MAELSFKVLADYQQVLEAQRRVEEFEKYINNLKLNAEVHVDSSHLANEINGIAKLLQGLVNSLSSDLGVLTQEINRMGASLKGASTNLNGVSQTSLSAGASMQQASQDASNLNHNLSQQPSAFDQVSASVSRFAQQFTAGALAYQAITKAIQGFQQSVGTIVSFTAANSTLQAILGVGDEQMQGFMETAEALGRSTVFTASQVTQLQTELSKLGFNEANIHAMEGSVLNFAQSVGTDLGNAASTAGAALRMFGVQEEEYTEQTIRYTNAMATATMRSALDFRSISENLATFGPMAHSMGMEIQDVLALFGILKNAGVEASTAMTSLRNIFTKVAQGKIEGMGKVKSLEDFVAGLKNMGSLDPGNGMKMIGPRGGTQFITLKEQADEILKLKGQIEEGMNVDTTGEMGERMVNNLAGQMKMLSSAWEGFILTFRNTDVIMKDAVAGLTDAIGAVREFIAPMGDYSVETIENVKNAMLGLIGVFATFKGGEYLLETIDAINERLGTISEANKELLTTNTAIIKGDEAIINKRNLRIAAELKSAETIVEVNQSVVDAIQEEVDTYDELFREETKNLVAALASGDAKKAEAIQTNLNEIATDRETAAKRLNTATTELNASKTKLNTTALVANAAAEKAKAVEGARAAMTEFRSVAATNTYTASATAQTLVLKLQTAAINLQALAYKGLTVAMMSVPYVAIAAGIAAVGYSIYQIATYETEAEKSLEAMKEKMEDATKGVNEEISKETATLKNNVNTLKAMYVTEGLAAAKSKTYQDTLKGFKKVLEANGLELQTFKTLEGEEIVGVDELTQKHKQLTEILEKENEIRRQKATHQAILEEENSQMDKAFDDFKKKLEDNDFENVEVVTTEIRAHVNEDDIEALVAVERAQQKLNDLRKAGKQSTKEYSDAEEQLRKAIASQKAEFEKQNKYIEEMGKALGWSKGQIEIAQKYMKEMLLSMRDAAWGSEYYRTAFSKMADTLAKQARLANMPLKELNNYLKELAKKNKYKITIITDYKTTGAVPEWMKKEFKADKKGLEALKANAAKFAYNAERGGGKVGGKYFTAEQSARKANQYDLYAQQIEEKLAAEAQKKQDEAAKKEQDASAANEARNRREAQKKLAEDRKKWAKEQAELEKQLQKDIDQARIDAMAEGEKKILAQSKHDHQKELDAIEKELKDLEEKQKERMKSLWNQDPDHKKKSDKKKTKNSEAQAGRDAVDFNEEDWKNGTGAYAEGGKYRKEWEKNQEILTLARQKATDKSIALGAKEVESLTKDYQTESEKRIQEVEKTNAIIEQMYEELFKKRKMLEDTNLSDEQRSGIEQQVQNLVNGIERANVKLSSLRHQELQSMYDYLKEYGTVEQQKYAITKEYEQKIAEARAKGDTFEVKKLEKQRDKDVNVKKEQELLSRIDFSTVFGEFGMILEEPLKNAIEDLRAYTKTDDFKSKSPTDQKTIMDALTNAEIKLGASLKDIDMEGIGNALNRYNIAVVNATNAKERETELYKELKSAQKEYEKALKTGKKDLIESAKAKVDDAQIKAAGASAVTQAAVTEQTNATTDLSDKSKKAAEALKGVEGVAKAIASGNASAAWQALPEDARKSVTNALSKVLGQGGNNFVSQIIGAVLSILDILKEGIGTLISSLISSIFDAIAGLLDNILSGDFLVQIGTAIVNGFAKIFDAITFGGFSSWFGGADYSEYEDALNYWGGRLEVWGQAVDKYTDKISKSSGVEAIKNANIAASYLQKSIEGTQDLVKKVLGAGASAGSHTIAHRMWEGSYQGENGRTWHNVAGEISQRYGKNFNNMSDLFTNFTAEELEEIKYQYIDLYNAMDGDARKYYDDLINFATQAEEIQEKLTDNLTQTSFDGMRDSFMNSLLDMESSSEEFAENFQKTMYKAMVNSFVLDEKFNEWLKDWQKRYAKAVEANNTDLLISLNDEAARKNEELREQSQKYAEALGVDDISSSEARGSINAAKAMSEDTANELIGRITAVQLGVERIAAQDISIGAAENALLANLDAKMNAYIEASRETQAQGVGMLESIQDILATSYIELRGINENTSAIVEPIRAMSSEISTMRNKIDTL
ncbi:MAG: phage tail tape measure protein [Prevotella sp.]|nr:phage tail tape measure protein [Candidatus Prevotella equi]